MGGTACTFAASVSLTPPRGWETAGWRDQILSASLLVTGVARNWVYDRLPQLTQVHRSSSWRGPDYLSWVAHNQFETSLYGRVAISVIGGFALALPFGAAARVLTCSTRQARWVDGPRLFDGFMATRKARRSSRTQIRRTRRGINLAPGVPIAREREIRSLMVIGSQRSGKTVFLRYLIRQLRQTPARLVVHCTKGDMTASWPDDNFLLLAPQDARSYAWDVGQDIHGELATFEFAASLVPEGKDPQWAQGAQLILTGFIVALQRQFDRAWGWRELCDVLQLPPAEMHALVQRFYPAAATLLSLDDTNEQFNRNSQSYFNTLIGPLLRLVRPLAAAWGDIHEDFRISLTSWLDDRAGAPPVLVLQRMPRFPETSRLWITAALRHMVAITGGANFEDSVDRRLWFVIDEFPQIGRIPNLFDVPATHAAKGVCLAVVLQSFSQAQEVYGARAPDQLSTLTGTKVIMRLEPGDTAHYVASKLVGPWRYQVPVTVSRPTADGKGRSETEWQDRKEDLLLPSSFRSLGPVLTGVRGMVLGLDDGNVYELEWPYEDWPHQRPGAVPASWITALPGDTGG